ncbi:hypothetical protein GCM10010317_103870 [Streptomyces mirabilis]|uniref:hypothetical protein n=1 Tax=Streptomyces mirabilis TaxID=68239 RepID=UPI00167CCECA|nr:hypothetical protein [Streptomyces mirabilis]GHD81074.1 hypothetical protein GCM10010317_103870 [Streptomyces mirabilis]
MALSDEEWERPNRIGAPHAVDQAHFVAAPLLASAAVATVGVLGADGARFRWPGPAMLCFTVAAIFLIASVQLAFRGRSYLCSPAELYDWWTDVNRPRHEVLRGEHKRDFAQWTYWVSRAANTYNLGIVALGLGAIGLLARPKGPQPRTPGCGGSRSAQLRQERPGS